MEKQTRINKYKDLREEMKEEVAIDRRVVTTSTDEDDDFLAFLPHAEKPKLDDTLIEPLSYETLNKDNEDVKSALNEAKVNVGKEQYNTRLDILSKIKQDDSDYIPAHEYRTQDFSQGHVVKEEPQKKMSLLEKLAAMSPEEDAEELKRYEEDLTIADLMKDQKKKKKAKPVVEEILKSPVQEKPKRQRQRVIEEPVVYDEDDEHEDSKVVTILNYVIIVFIVIFIVLAGFIVKQLLF